MLCEALYHETQRGAHVTKGRMNPDLIVGIELERQREIGLVFDRFPNGRRTLNFALPRQ